MTEERSHKIEDDVGMRLLIPVGRSGWAIAAGYLGLFSILMIPAPLAMITGILAVVDIQKSQRTENKKYGMGRAIFGLIMGSLFTFLLIIALLNSMGR